mmetsp:Transcript_161880/g.295512  ORF Transcript_161880/g.295512 Transcript_161880/m.295512 type:complete len:265 (+) Transcript_161880:505-1299(+)
MPCPNSISKSSGHNKLGRKAAALKAFAFALSSAIMFTSLAWPLAQTDASSCNAIVATSIRHLTASFSTSMSRPVAACTRTRVKTFCAPLSVPRSNAQLPSSKALSTLSLSAWRPGQEKIDSALSIDMSKPIGTVDPASSSVETSCTSPLAAAGGTLMQRPPACARTSAIVGGASFWICTISYLIAASSRFCTAVPKFCRMVWTASSTAFSSVSAFWVHTAWIFSAACFRFSSSSCSALGPLLLGFVDAPQPIGIYNGQAEAVES